LTSYTLAFALQLRKKHGKTSLRVAARTSQTDTVKYSKNEQYKSQKKNSNTKYYNTQSTSITNGRVVTVHDMKAYGVVEA
jgi:hypothetical protein